MPPPTNHRPNPLRALFMPSGQSEILVAIFDHLTLHDIPALLRVNKYVNGVFISSSRLQLRYRRAYHSLASNIFLSTPGRPSNSADEIATLLERERRLKCLRPSEIRCLHIPKGDVIGVKDNYMLVSECVNQMAIDPNDPDQENYWDGWSIWRMRDTTSFDGESRGAKKLQGMWRWKFNFGGIIDATDMCVEDNVIAVAYSVDHPPCESIEVGSMQKVVHRIYFYTLVPPVGTPQQPDGVFPTPIPHPDAKLPYIEVLVPARLHLHRIEVHMGAGGKVGLLLTSADQFRSNFVGLWDWKMGVSIGKLSPTADTPVCDDFRFLGPFIVSASMKELPKPADDDFMDLFSRQPPVPLPLAKGPLPPPEPKAPLRPEKKSANSPQTKSRASMYDDIDYDSEEDSGFTASSAILGRPSVPAPKNPTSVYDDIDYNSEEDILNEPIPAKPPTEMVYALDTLGHLPVERGSKPTKRRSDKHVGPGQEIVGPCTWDEEDIPYCMPLASLQLPALNTAPPFGVSKSPLDVILDYCVIDTEFQAVRLAIEDFTVDNELLSGERQGLMPFVLAGTTADGLGRSMPTCCKGMVDIKMLIDKSVEAMRWHMAKAQGVDLKLLMLGTKLNKKHWRDQLAEAFVLFSKTATEDGWETDEDIYSRYLPKQKANKKRPGAATFSKKAKKTGYKWDRPYRVPFKDWQSAVSMRFNGRPEVSVSGTRTITIERIPNAKPVIRKKDGQMMIRNWLVMHDYSRRTYRENPMKPRQFLGGLPPPPPLDTAATAGPSTAPLASELPLKPFDRPRVIKCPQPVPLPLAGMDSEPAMYKTSKMEDKRLWTKRIFEEEIVQSHLPFTETRTKVLFDVARPTVSALFDGRSLVVGVDQGAHIFTF
ncbi:hypothetical protein L202_02781 [Cryptococcus amylolentus CBS 6039]|uniref:F-box domain-containing protein n=1 Tax=Cryptococcus amylolentus CBS 6039 TaxID=1295533 RepID=A0A1E3HW95_9TREE|nr:hypothetical protein L202_02781 [Cryptococcus amylolentus CBS 6039]ODN80589.1 hypothetical protein L202_02781 [Cryptococcus amylolentus CBS 6039]